MCSICSILLYWALPIFIIILGTCYLIGKETLWLIWHTLPRDIKLASIVHRVKRRTGRMKNKNTTIVDIFESTVKLFPSRPMFKFQGTVWTFQEVEREAESIAAFFQNLGIRKGDCVGLLMENSPNLVIYWLGLAKIGAISALINFNQRQGPLLHSFKISSAKAIVCSDSLFDEALEPIRDDLQSIPDSMIFIHAGGKHKLVSEGSVGKFSGKYQTIDEETKSFEGKTFCRPQIGYEDTVVYIFTSGTTGLPKAAKLKHARMISVSVAFHELLKTKPEDIIWSPLPLYHSNAGIIGIGQTLIAGCCLALRPKFSASNFWKDIVESEATIFVYLGEICRYIYAQPVTPIETQHKLRIIFGAGLKKELWNNFLTRYQIPKVLELYGSTEGNANTVNLSQKEGACGVTSRLFPWALPINLVKIDANGDLLRDSNGVCIKCRPGEPGMVVGKIIPNDAISKFDGYIGTEETSRKIARDVFKKGDRAFLSGDTMVMDREGFLYFKDRTGDTFRWKGENVSTTEVEAVIFPAVGQKDVIVFGVEVPENDGKAGMAAILNDQQNVDMQFLTAVINKNLPTYARPLFIRLLHNSEQHLTGTYKLKKTELVREGFMHTAIEDLQNIFYYDVKTKKYLQFNEDVLEKIKSGEIKF